MGTRNMGTRNIIFPLASLTGLVLSGAALSLVASCDHRVFDDLEDQIQVHAGKEPASSPSAGYGVGLVTAGGSELQYFIASKSPPALFMAKFDENGARSPLLSFEIQGVLTTAEALPTPTVMESDPANFAGAAGNVAVAVVDGGSPFLYMLRGDNGEAQDPIALTGADAASGIAFGNTDLDVGTDLLALAGQHVNLVADYQGGAAKGACDLGENTGDVLIADVGAATGGEVLIAVGSAVVVTTATVLSTAATDEVGCFETTPAAATITAPEMEASFGTLLRAGDFDGNGAVDLVVAAPGENAVYVYSNWTEANPSAGVKIAAPDGAVLFGSAIAIGDFGGDGRDDLVIGDPGLDVGANPSAGSVFIYAGEAGGGFAAPVVLHDATPQDDQVFGQSLSVSQAFGGDRLVVGAKNEVFTYFQTPVAGDSDFRE